MKSKKPILIILALMLAACLSAAALAEDPAPVTGETPVSEAAADAAKAAADDALAAAETAQAESAALNEALEAYGKAKAESRKLDVLASLKEELDGYVAAGSLTQEQADLILKYYAEQLTLAQQSGGGFGRGRKGGHDRGFGPGMNGSMNPGADFGGRNNDFGRNRNRFSNTDSTPPQDPAAPAAPADQDSGSI